MKQAPSDHSSAPLWNTEQEQAMHALGLTVWQVANAEPTPIQSEQHQVYYQVGRWLVATDEQLPIPLDNWTKDVFRALDPSQPQPQPVEIAATSAQTWAPSQHLNGAKFIGKPLKAAQKRQLWAKICGD